MFGRVATRLTCFLLKHSTLSLENKALLITCVLDRLAAVRLHGIISVNETGQLLVNGRSLELEKARILHESAKAALKSPALKIIREQVVYEAFSYGTYDAQNIEQMFFSKAALWWGQQEDKFLKLLAGNDEDGSSSQEGD